MTFTAGPHKANADLLTAQPKQGVPEKPPSIADPDDFSTPVPDVALHFKKKQA
jgi:hypothetical protein